MRVTSLFGLLLCTSISAARRLAHPSGTNGNFIAVSAAAASKAARPNPAGGYFKDFAVAGVSGIGAAITFDKDILLLDRTDGTNTHIKLPNGQVTYSVTAHDSFSLNLN